VVVKQSHGTDLSPQTVFWQEFTGYDGDFRTTLVYPVTEKKLGLPETSSVPFPQVRLESALKFKAAVIAFNVIVLLFALVVFVVPFAVLGKELGAGFLRSSWIMAPALLVFLGVLDLYFALNYRVVLLLEKEDWPALVQELERRVLHRGNYRRRLVKLLANSYLVLSDAPAVNALEKKLAVARPTLVNANVLVFGAARLLSGDNRGAVDFFKTRLPGGAQAAGTPPAGREWLSWYYGFALLLNREFAAAADCFTLLAEQSEDGVIVGLSAYFLGSALKKLLPARDSGPAAAAKERVRRFLRVRADWDREIKRLETELHAAVLTNYLGKTADYIYE
jgi:hypothetical protein